MINRNNLLIRFIRLIDFRNQLEDVDNIHKTVLKDVNFRGTNLWILVCAILVASVGLNTNSTAVIIGAMLISPLMGPINAMGYSIATYDFVLFRKSIKNFSFAVGASLIASTLYFTISPVSTAHSELLARTSPSIYDVLIALFGGLAGIIAISSRFKGNVIPGVAIATALMPPLCTAGYGLATAQFTFFFGALYLFTINTVFIAFASLFVSQALKFPIRTIVDPKRKKQVNQVISTIITITLLPSLYFGYILVQKEKFAENALLFSKNITLLDGSYLLKYDINASKEYIHLVYGGNALSDIQKKKIAAKAKEFGLEKAEIEIDQGFALDEGNVSESDLLKNEIRGLQETMLQKEKTIDSLLTLHYTGKQLLRELKPLYPQVFSCSYSETVMYSDSTSLKGPLLLIGLKQPISKTDEDKIQQWLSARLNRNNIYVHFTASKAD